MTSPNADLALVISDANRAQLIELLGSSFTVVEVSTGAGGLRAYSSISPACVLLDARLPDLAGLDVLRSLVGLGAAVIMVSGHRDGATAAQALSAGANDFLAKDDLSRDRLVSAMRRAMKARALERDRSAPAADPSWERMLLSILKQTTDFVGATKLDGQVLFINPAGVRLLGLPHDRAGDWYPPDEARRLADEILPVVLRGGRWAGELELQHGDGTTIVTDAVIVKHPAASGHPAFVSTVCRDRTAQISIEKELLRAQKLESAGRLAGGIAHDFNNVLTAILSFTGFVRDDLPIGDPRRADLDEVLSAADRAGDLTRQLLMFSKRLPTSPERCDVAASVLGLETLLRATVDESIALSLTTPAQPAYVLAEPGLLDQVVLNLVVNARDAMPDGGRLDVVVDVGEPATLVEIRVSDTGCGMDEETVRRAFDPFFTTKGPDVGTGLGLSTCYGIVQKLGGTITVETAPGAGAVFTVRLPYAEHGPPPSTDPEFPSTTYHQGTETILVIEDDGAVRRLTTRALQRAGYTVLLARTADAAREVYEANASSIDMVFCDVVLPGGSGLELIEAFRADRPDLPVLLTTGYTEHSALAAAGDLPLLWKPYSPVTLTRRIREALDVGGPD